ncbi:MAG: Mur ligase family protein, partial [Verrucomicrobia bacterium]|nr:Mur ligase family protein [Verrucomicrobiota bacterium]
VFLNLHPDHLDRHATMAEYAALKARLFARQEAGDVAIVHAPCRPTLRDALPGGLLATVVTFGGNTPADYEYADGVITRRRDAQRISLAGTRFANAILGQSAAAAMAAVDACGRDGRVVEAVATDFAGLPHRMVDLGMIKGVRFINDSKATNLSALAAALQMVNGPVRLIAGGRLKENNLESIQEILAKQASAVYLVGEAAGLMAAAWRDTVTCHPVGTLQAAVRAAWNDACVGESILLSPGCASFDQFNGYAHRGDVFTNLVMRLVEEQ